jgi:hypothetical protein
VDCVVAPPQAATVEKGSAHASVEKMDVCVERRAVMAFLPREMCSRVMNGEKERGLGQGARAGLTRSASGDGECPSAVASSG